MASRVFGVGRSSDCSGGFIGGTALVWAGGLGLLAVFVVPGELKKVSFLPKRLTVLKISDLKPWELRF